MFYILTFCFPAFHLCPSVCICGNYAFAFLSDLCVSAVNPPLGISKSNAKPNERVEVRCPAGDAEIHAAIELHV